MLQMVQRYFLLLVLSIVLVSAPSATTGFAQSGPEGNFGPKQAVAVIEFGATGSIFDDYGGTEVSGALATILESELQLSGAYIVIDRGGWTEASQQGDAGREFDGAQFYFRGLVTELAFQESGGGMSLNVGTLDFLGGLARNTERGHMTVDISMLDATTGVVIETITVEQEIRSSSVALLADMEGYALGRDSFEHTSLASVARAAIHDAVRQFSSRASAHAWRGMVSTVQGDRIYINAGSNANLTVGMRFRAIRQLMVITDPVTGEMLGHDETSLGDLTLERVEERFAVGTYSGEYAVERGDIVQLLPD